jgi:ribosomal protein L37AE/L43A
MSWTYTLRDELRMPHCPYCRSLTGVVRLKGSIYACLDCLPRRAFEAHWQADETPLSEAPGGRRLTG